MNQVKQTNRDLAKPLQIGGCLLMAHAAIIGRYRGRPASVNELHAIHQKGVDLGCYRTNTHYNAYVLDHPASLDLCAQVLDVPVRYISYPMYYWPATCIWKWRGKDLATDLIEQVNVIGAHSHFRVLGGYDSYPSLPINGVRSIRGYQIKVTPRSLVA